ncbi:NAD-dependent epimerase/dehydratase family protein [Candidatus Electronema sp. JM]|uniref:NAD-dependent epimerase/dehydratase family protein n=1 Tax=Candidatus Electronema sp. JM TaxID=3401571 RepID=UPI003AA83829
MNIILTGTTGFIGSALLSTFSQQYQVRPITRAEAGDILPEIDWTQALDNVDIVIHLAAISTSCLTVFLIRSQNSAL